MAPRLEFHPLVGIPGVIVVDAFEELKHLKELEPPARIHALSRTNVEFIKTTRDRLRSELRRIALRKGGEELAERCRLTAA